MTERQMPMDLGTIDEAVSNAPRTAVVNRLNYGITEDRLNTLSMRELFLVFYGLHQLKIPHEIGLLLNPAERLAKLIAAQVVKSDPAQHADISSQDFTQAVRSLDRIGYDYQGILKVKREGNVYSVAPGAQQERMRSLEMGNPAAVEEFLESLRLPQVYSDAESGTHNSFHDPNIDGNSKKVYVGRIREFTRDFYVHGERLRTHSPV